MHVNGPFASQGTSAVWGLAADAIHTSALRDPTDTGGPACQSNQSAQKVRIIVAPLALPGEPDSDSPLADCAL